MYASTKKNKSKKKHKKKSMPIELNFKTFGPSEQDMSNITKGSQLMTQYKNENGKYLPFEYVKGNNNNNGNNGKELTCHEVASIKQYDIGPKNHGFVQALFDAWNNHFKFSIRPDDIWLMILQGINSRLKYIKQEKEKHAKAVNLINTLTAKPGYENNTVNFSAIIEKDIFNSYKSMNTKDHHFTLKHYQKKLKYFTSEENNIKSRILLHPELFEEGKKMEIEVDISSVQTKNSNFYSNGAIESVLHDAVNKHTDDNSDSNNDATTSNQQSNVDDIFEPVIKAWSSDILKYTKEDFKHFATLEFSTTTQTDKLVFQSTILGICEDYFTYVGSTCCGFPSIILQGNLHDWSSLRINAKGLLVDFFNSDVDKNGKKSFFKSWHQAIDSVLSRFEAVFTLNQQQQQQQETSKPSSSSSLINPETVVNITNEDDFTFWNSMLKSGAIHGSGGYTSYNGWVNAFLPICKSDKVLKVNQCCGPYDPNHFYVKCKNVDSVFQSHGEMNKFGGIRIDDFPCGVVKVPIVWRDGSGDDRDFVLSAGFIKNSLVIHHQSENTQEGGEKGMIGVGTYWHVEPNGTINTTTSLNKKRKINQLEYMKVAEEKFEAARKQKKLIDDSMSSMQPFNPMSILRKR